MNHTSARSHSWERHPENAHYRPPIRTKQRLHFPRLLGLARPTLASYISFLRSSVVAYCDPSGATCRRQSLTYYSCASERWLVASRRLCLPRHHCTQLTRRLRDPNLPRPSSASCDASLAPRLRNTASADERQVCGVESDQFRGAQRRGPFLEEDAVEAFDLAVGLGPVGPVRFGVTPVSARAASHKRER